MVGYKEQINKLVNMRVKQSSKKAKKRYKELGW